jgi:hypothetical protein
MGLRPVNLGRQRRELYLVWGVAAAVRPGLRGWGGATLEGPAGTTTVTDPVWRLARRSRPASTAVA